jgi:type I restriction enzyme R subunit
MNSSNFDFLRPVAPGLLEIAAQAEGYVHTDPAASVVKARNFVEQAILGIYQGLRLERLGRADLFELLSGAEFQRIVPRQVLLKLHAIRKHGNVGAHEGNISARVSLLVLEELFDVARWLYVSHLRGRIEDIPSYRQPPPTPEDRKGHLKREKREALQKLAAQEARFQETLNELAAARDAQSVAEAEASRLQQELTTRGAAAVDELHFNEKTTRRRLIDSMLIEAGWNVGPNGANTDEITQEERVEHQPTETGEGHVDYVLWDDDGKPLALVEAKRTSIDAKDGQIQARHYAEGLDRIYGRRPVILCTNGFENWIWDDAQGYPPRTIFGFYSKAACSSWSSRDRTLSRLHRCPLIPAPSTGCTRSTPSRASPSASPGSAARPCSCRPRAPVRLVWPSRSPTS